nr:helix-turn-helix domain-containing protein [Phytohabitans flavus]
MRALAHPARLAIMEELGTGGGGLTATEAAEVAGLSPSATSYHLRALARYGLVEEAPSRGDARERVWRSTVHSWQVDSGASDDPETQAAEGALVDAYLAREVERIRDWRARAGDEPAEWSSAALMSESVLLLSADELKSFNDEVLRLIEPYKRRHRIAAPPEGARTVVVTYKAVPLD